MGILPASLGVRTMDVAGLTMRLHVLDDGRRVIDADDMNAFILMAKAGKITPDVAKRVSAWARSDA